MCGICMDVQLRRARARGVTHANCRRRVKDHHLVRVSACLCRRRRRRRRRGPRPMIFCEIVSLIAIEWPSIQFRNLIFCGFMFI